MTGLKPVMHQVADAAMTMARRVDSDLPESAVALGRHSRKVATGTHGIDHYDGTPDLASKPDAHRTAEGSGSGSARNDGRDERGRFNGDGSRPLADKEKIGLARVAKEKNTEVNTNQVKVDYDGSPQNGRKYDGLIKNTDGINTYTGVEIKSGNAIKDYIRPGNTQFQFDRAVNSGTLARGKIDGEEILVTKVIIKEVL